MSSHQPSAVFWKGKRVFLTGHTGFKGSWLSFWLKQMGAEVFGFSLEPNTQPALFEKLDLQEIMHSQIGDIRDLEALSESLKRAQPDIVFHLAAQPLVRLSYRDPLLTYSTNVMGTAHLLEACRKWNETAMRKLAVVVATTDKVYENKEWHWPYREGEPLGGKDPYSSSKACAELVCSAYRSSYFQSEASNIRLVTARAGNVIGGGDWSDDRLVPDMVRAWQNSRPVVLRNPNSTRPWQHVLEPVGAYLKLAEALFETDNPKRFDCFNFGPEDADCWPVGKVTEVFASAWKEFGAGIPKLEFDKGPHPAEAGALKLDSSKAKAQLKWNPIWSVEKSLKETARWYQLASTMKLSTEYRTLCENQISEWSKAE